MIFFLPDALGILIVEIGILLAASRYGFKITALGSRGIYNADDYPAELDPDWKNLPGSCSPSSLRNPWWWAGCRREPHPGHAGLAGDVFCCPPADRAGADLQLCRNPEPANAWNAVRTVGWPYLLLCVFLFLLSQGTFIALGLLLPLFRGWILLPIVNWVLIYFSWVMASLLGYAMLPEPQAFGIDLAARRRPGR